MRLSISNIAWEKEEEPQIALLLRQLGVSTVDIAPGKYFPEPSEVTDTDIRKVKSWWEERGISIYGMQSLLFGTKGLNVFGDSHTQNKLLSHLCHICRIAAGLGAKRLVFGSPKNRDRTGLSDNETEEISLQFFNRLGDIAQSYGVVVTLEPNPVCYGTNWIMFTREAFRFVKTLGNPGIAMQLDTGTLLANHEGTTVISEVKEAIGHVHLSEPQLLPLSLAPDEHCAVFRSAIDSAGEVVTIEMLTKGRENSSRLIESSVMKVQKLLMDRD